MQDSNKIIIALDFTEANQARMLLKQLTPELCRVKIGKALFTTAGPSFLRECIDLGFDVFLDLKYHDIPNTVAQACEAAAKLGVWMVNVHAFGGLQMLKAARHAIDSCAHKPLLIGVTVLTSMDNASLNEIGVQTNTEQTVLSLAKLARQASLDGLVCSAQETAMLREQFGPDWCLVTPGIRPAGESDDQKRVMTPPDAIKAGSSYLVIGRPITKAANPLEALTNIHLSIN